MAKRLLTPQVEEEELEEEQAKLFASWDQAGIKRYISIVFCDKENLPDELKHTVKVLLAAFFQNIRASEQSNGVDTAKKLEKFLWLALRTPVPENVEFLMFWKLRIIACINLLRSLPYPLMIYPRDNPTVKERSEAMMSSFVTQYHSEISTGHSGPIVPLELPVSEATAEPAAVFAAALAALKSAAPAAAAQKPPAVEEIQPSRRSERVANKLARLA
jgi:hypothetical protein